MSLIHWHETEYTGRIPELDDPRRRFVELVNSMEGAEDGQLRVMFIRLLAHIEHWLERENRLMEEYRFPHRREHLREHEQVINEVRYMLQRIENGLYSLGHTYVKARLPQWFRSHLEEMDSALYDHLLTDRKAA
jgi:hemerythrin-like metal-binding protein